jgi:fumarylacetoacetase
MAHLDEGSCARTSALDIVVQAWISSEAMRATDTPPLLIASSNLREMYWTYPQIVAHQTSNGCDLSPGDLLGSGTISGPSSASRGCLAEHAVPIALPDGTSRKWLSDGDEITFRATASREGYVSIGFGECRSQILPAVVTS